MNEKSISFCGINASYSVQGEGEAIVFIHGFLLNKSIWNELIDLIPDYKCISVDLFGHGNTDDYSEQYTMDLQAEMVGAIMKKEGVAHAHVVGHSMGGYVALALLDLFPDMVNELTLFHSIAMADSAAAKRKRELYCRVVNNFPKEFVEAILAKLVTKNYGKKEIVEQLSEDAYKIPIPVIEKASLAMRDRPDRQEVVKEANVPVHYFIGDFDEVMDPEMQKNEALSLGASSFSSYYAGHLAQKECLEDVVYFFNEIKENKESM